MKIESIIKRNNAARTGYLGTKSLTPDGSEYHFQPEDGRFTSPHVADVGNADHIAHFLAIREGYRVAGDQAGVRPAAAAAPASAAPTTAPLTPKERMAKANAARLAARGTSTAAPKAPAPVHKAPAPVKKADTEKSDPDDVWASLSDGAIADQYTQAFGAAPDPKELDRNAQIAALKALPPKE